MSGLFLQFVFGLFVLRWNKGFQAAEFLGNQTVVFLEYTIAGSSFVFGEEWYIHGFVMYVSILFRVQNYSRLMTDLPGKSKIANLQ